MSDKYYNEDGSIYSFRDKKRHYKNRVNTHSRKVSLHSSSHLNKQSGRYYADKVCFSKILLRYVFRLLRMFLFYIAFALLFTFSNNYSVALFLTYVWLLGSIGVIFHFIYFIIRCYKEDNLRI